MESVVTNGKDAVRLCENIVRGAFGDVVCVSRVASDVVAGRTSLTSARRIDTPEPRPLHRGSYSAPRGPLAPDDKRRAHHPHSAQPRGLDWRVATRSRRGGDVRIRRDGVSFAPPVGAHVGFDRAELWRGGEEMERRRILTPGACDRPAAALVRKAGDA